MKVLDRRKMILVNGVLLVLLALSVVGCALLGPVRLDLSKALQNIFSANPDAEIFFRARLPRVLLGVAIGGGMASLWRRVAGVIGQPACLPADARRVRRSFPGRHLGTDFFSQLASADRRRAPWRNLLGAAGGISRRAVAA